MSPKKISLCLHQAKYDSHKKNKIRFKVFASFRELKVATREPGVAFLGDKILALYSRCSGRLLENWIFLFEHYLHSISPTGMIREFPLSLKSVSFVLISFVMKCRNMFYKMVRLRAIQQLNLKWIKLWGLSHTTCYSCKQANNFSTRRPQSSFHQLRVLIFRLEVISFFNFSL